MSLGRWLTAHNDFVQWPHCDSFRVSNHTCSQFSRCATDAMLLTYLITPATGSVSLCTYLGMRTCGIIVSGVRQTERRGCGGVKMFLNVIAMGLVRGGVP